MKKLLIFTVILTTLSLGACSRRANCPAYGSVQKHTPAQVRVNRKIFQQILYLQAVKKSGDIFF